ncbi:MAG: hypothetical protein Q7U63_13705 [Polaromonas sp.]|uniref:DUF6036 family nucleotidyltransferase n=1 Tax=Polaromonas sp. TaxID=1869339 RepID=UPI00271F95AC|nr:DUF6036 family nucleotidyltransferase [Polaromonas sp.]MDO9114832.1 hypothetical protein [Polaromonas sp.]MDP1887619.1 hypothetical protein [Polaromonas sp.]
MNLDALFAMFKEARRLSGHTDFVVIGSLSILGLEQSFEIPDTMTLSNDVDCFTQADPGRIFDLLKSLGENSPYHEKSGYFLDPVSPDLPTLPEGWHDRLIKVERDGLRAWFLDPNDAALSKYARGEPRDRRWIKAGILAGVVSMPIVKSRVGSTSFFDADEEQRARALIEEDRAWFEFVKDSRSDTSPGNSKSPQ